METYRIVRMFFNGPSKPVKGLSGLTLEKAQEHCRDPETSSRTCTSSTGRARTEALGPWFDGYEQE